MPKLTPEERAEHQRALDEDNEEEDFAFDYSEGDRSVGNFPWSKRHELPALGFKGIPKPPAAKGDSAANSDKGKTPGRTSPTFMQRRGQAS